MLAPSKNQQTILFLGASEEMRHPYESLLSKMNLRAEWISSFSELYKMRLEAPLGVVIDIDPLSRPLEPHLEAIRFQFPKSELIAISSTDSAPTALLVIRSGFTDFLLKPISPEELVWSVKKAIQKNELFQKLQEPETHLVRALTQISSSSTPSLVRLSTLEFLQDFFKSKGAGWISFQEPSPTVVCSYPRGVNEQEILTTLSHLKKTPAPPPAVTWPKNNVQHVFLSCLESTQGVVLWGIANKIEEETLLIAKTLLEHAELSLLNLEKFEEVKQLTFVDELTGLYNSRYLRHALANTINRSKNKGKPFAVLFIDVDYFKSINTAHGHIVGSDFLIAIGRSIKNAVRETDVVFRYGGDEFVVILNDSEIEGAKVIAERMRLGVERRVFSIHGMKLKTTISVGIAMYPEHAKDQDSLLKLADMAMYSAKELSRNTVHIYTTDLFEDKPEKAAS
ncbi:MAG: diguanylate cyclase [Pseudomonadota bacterium]